MLKNSLEKLQLKSIVKESNFVFESFNNNGDQQNFIYGKNLIESFDDLIKLENYLLENQSITESQEAGLVGYQGFDNKSEFFLYENIYYHNASLVNDGNLSLKTKFEIIFPEASDFIQAVLKAQEYIKEGEIYQVNLAQKFIINKLSCEENINDTALKLYSRLRKFNPSPYMGFMETKEHFILSSSPESFIKIKNNNNNEFEISSSPIKGTAGENHLQELISSSKERAEHIMIVDLIRNDLGRICKTGSIEANRLLEIKHFKEIYHLVSEITGILDPEKAFLGTGRIPSLSKIFKAISPGGSISGTPKIRAIDIINELEDSPREAYTGTMGYYCFNGSGEFNILIRTIIIDKVSGEISFHVGSGITANSIAEKEFEENLLKAKQLLKVFTDD